MSSNRKPTLEKVNPGFGSSFSLKHYADEAQQAHRPFWHFHPEIELVYIKGGSGKRHIGNHLSYYQSGDLVLIGSMLPHSGFTDRLSGNESETVIQFRDDCFGADFFQLSEMQDIQQLLIRAKAGVSYYGLAKEKIGRRIEGMVELNNFSRLLELLKVLKELAEADEYKLLNAEGYSLEVDTTDDERINLIYNYVQANFQRPIPLEEIAGVANMTVPSFCRYFKRISNKKFTRFTNEIRIVHACKLLTHSKSSIAEISLESGFNNFSHFNRQFKEFTGESPMAYRKQFKRMLNDSTD